jgi:DNA-binding SARP family transcriptional activator/predicted ATPase
MTASRPASWLALLGPLSAHDADGAEVSLGGPKQRLVLATLLLDPNRVVPVDRMIDRVWGDDSRAASTSTLQVYVHNLRRIFEQFGDDAGPTIVTRRPGYVLEADPATIDHLVFEQRLAKAAEQRSLGHHHEAYALVEASLGLWRGRALDGLPPMDWVGRLSDSFEQRRLDAMELRNDAALASGAMAGLASGLEELVEEHPLRERFWEQFIVALYRAGRQHDALAAYQRVRQVLIDELGLEPGPALRNLEQAVLNHDPVLNRGAGRGDGGGDTAVAPGPRPPKAMTSMVGRRFELAAVQALIEQRRVVTIIGPPGVGKSTLALEVARDHEARGGRAMLVDLSTVILGDEAERRVAEVVAALGSSGPPGTLIVIDGCEQVRHRIADVAGRAAGSADVTILATSQVALEMPDEGVFSLAPLPTPAPGSSFDLEALAGIDSVRLFEGRARVVSPAFTLDEATAPAVIRIVQALDGIPLAIELAASQLRHVAVADLSRSLDDGLDMLTPAGSGTGRHDTLGNAMAWSLDSLDDESRDTMRALCSLVGSFTLDDATAVCGSTSIEVVRAVIDLVDRSLVSLQQEPDGAMRYRLLAPVRRIVETELGPHDAEVARRHTVHFVGQAVATGPLDLRWQSTMTLIVDNVAAALRYAISDSDTLHAVQAAVSLCAYHRRRGSLERADAALAAVLPMVPSLPEDQAFDVLLAAAALAVDRADCMRALDLAGEVVRRAELLGDPRRQAHGLLVEASARRAMGEHDLSRVVLDSALELFDAAADVRGTAVALGRIGALLRVDGAPDLAAGLLEQGLARLSSVRGASSGWTVADMVTHQRGRSLLLAEMGSAAATEGDLDRAAALFTESLLVSAADEHRHGVAETLQAIAVLDTQRGQRTRAATLLGAALAILDADPTGEPTVEHKRLQAVLVSDLGLDVYREHSERGRSMVFDQAVRLGLDAAASGDRTSQAEGRGAGLVTT